MHASTQLRRHRILRFAALIFIVMLLASGGYGLWFTYTTEAPPQVAGQIAELNQVSWYSIALGLACCAVWLYTRPRRVD